RARRPLRGTGTREASRVHTGAAACADAPRSSCALSSGSPAAVRPTRTRELPPVELEELAAAAREPEEQVVGSARPADGARLGGPRRRTRDVTGSEEGTVLAIEVELDLRAAA